MVDVLVVKRWVRYGHDRLYVGTAAGERVGYWDNITCQAHLYDELQRSAFEAALAGFRVHRKVARARPPAPVGRSQPAMELPAERAWTDLEGTAPGTATRQRALAERAAAPLRTLVARALGARTDERAWRVGADGETAVADRLARLGPSWRVLHAVPIGYRGADIDHVVIGPGGVYVVNSKHHPKARVWVGGNTLMVNGHKTFYVRNSRFEAARSSRLLGAAAGSRVAVTGLIAVTGARQLSVRSQPPCGNVHVVTRNDIVAWLRRREPVLSDPLVDVIYELARRSTTWQQS